MIIATIYQLLQRAPGVVSTRAKLAYIEKRMATKADLARLKQRTTAVIAAMKERMRVMEERVAAMERRVAAMEKRVTTMEKRMAAMMAREADLDEK